MALVVRKKLIRKQFCMQYEFVSRWGVINEMVAYVKFNVKIEIKEKDMQSVS